jgi:hypothetical protein
MRSVLQGRPDKIFERPNGLTRVEVCDMSGLLPTPICPHVKAEWFIAGTQPTTRDTFYKMDSGKIVLDLPLQAQAWAKSQGFALLGDKTDSPALILTSPTDNTTYRLSPNFDLSAQQLNISALADSNFKQVTFFVDGVAIATISAPPFQTWWMLAVGEHRFWAEGIKMNGEKMKSNEVRVTVVK